MRENLAAAMQDAGTNTNTNAQYSVLPDEKMRHTIATAIGNAL
jgi:hypothetical protein